VFFLGVFSAILFTHTHTHTHTYAFRIMFLQQSCSATSLISSGFLWTMVL
jgi:hypothetical protein